MVGKSTVVGIGEPPAEAVGRVGRKGYLLYDRQARLQNFR